MLYPGQDVKVNGSVAKASSAINSGDTVQTGTSDAQFTSRGLMAELEPNSKVRYGDVLLLSCGGMTLSSSANGVQVGDTKIVPVNGTAKFRVNDRGGKLAISVTSGTVRVSSESASTLSAGQSTERSASDGCPALAGAPQSTGRTSNGKRVGLGAAGAGSAVVGIRLFRNDASPSSPK